MKYGSLFSGIGGFDLGLSRAGMHCAWQVENASFCLKVLQKHWPDVPKFGDVRDVGKHNLAPVGLVVGGFPCQPHSVAGKRRGAEDDRNLWPEFLRVVKELRPTWVLAENVPGIVSLYLDTVLADLEGEGYTCWAFNIPACAFNAPHVRKRIFIVAHADYDKHHKQQGKVRETNERPKSGRTKLRAGGRYQDMAYTNGQDDAKYNRSCRLSEQQGKTSTAWAKAARQKNREASDDSVGRHGEIVADTNGEGLSHRGQARFAPRKDEAKRKMAQPEPERRGIFWWPTEPGVGRVAHGIPHRVDRLRTLGNAVVPQIAEWFGRCIMETEQEWIRDRRRELVAG